MNNVIFNINGIETLCRFEEVREDENFKHYKTTVIITKEEFLTAYNNWIKSDSPNNDSPVNEDCDGCMYEKLLPDKHPCIDCKNAHKNYWRPNND